MTNAPTVLRIDTPTLGDRSYLVHDGKVALVIDPQRDIERVLELAEREGVRITHVFETHLHNDYLTGGLALAQETGAAYHVNGADEVSFERVPVRDGDLISISDDLQLRVIATPGHTFNHLSYALDGPHPHVFTGGSLLFGSTGRPDLMGEDNAETLARLQHASAHRLVDELPEHTAVLPTHGFGSFCSATQAEGDSSTIGQERRGNPVLQLPVEDYVEQLLSGLDLYPAYYAHMQPQNAAGPAAAPLAPPAPVDKEVLRERLTAGEWVIDLRHRTAYAAGHVAGTVNAGLDGAIATWLGWVVPWGSGVTLLGASPEDVAEAQVELVRIGYDRFAGAATGDPQQWTDERLRTTRVATFADLAQVRHHRPVGVLDVRNPIEHAAAHVEGAINVPLGQLVDRMAEVPTGEVWVHCAGGYRASVAASLLARAGDRVPVLIDDSFAESAARSGLPVVRREVGLSALRTPAPRTTARRPRPARRGPAR